MSDRLRAIYERVTSWQRRTFPNQTAASILAHMRLELKEIEAAPHDIEERADMAILAMGVFDRAGIPMRIIDDRVPFMWGGPHHQDPFIAVRAFLVALEEQSGLSLRHILCGFTSGIPSLDSEEKFLSAIAAKMDKNEARRWPTPDQQVPGEPVEHIRDEEMHVEAVIAALTPAPDIIASEVDRLRARVAELEAERAEWRADNERLRYERNKIRAWLQAAPNEGAVEATHRLIREVNTLRNREGGR